MEVQVLQVNVKDLIEGLSPQVGQVQWDWARHGHLILKPRHVGPPLSNSSCTGSLATCLPICPRWLLMGRYKGPDPPTAG